MRQDFSASPAPPRLLTPPMQIVLALRGPPMTPLRRGLPGPAPLAGRTQAFGSSAAQRGGDGTDGPIGVCPLRGLWQGRMQSPMRGGALGADIPGRNVRRGPRRRARAQVPDFMTPSAARPTPLSAVLSA